MEHAAGTGTDLGLAVALLAAGVVAVPLFRLLGLGAVLGYLAAGVLVGPFGSEAFQRSAGRPARRRIRRRDVPVPDRPGDAPGEAVGDAAGYFRAWPCSGAGMRRAAVGRCHCVWHPASCSRDRRVRLRAVIDRGHHEDDGRPRREFPRQAGSGRLQSCCSKTLTIIPLLALVRHARQPRPGRARRHAGCPMVADAWYRCGLRGWSCSWRANS